MMPSVPTSFMTSLPNTDDGPRWPSHNVAMPIEIGNVRGTTSNVGVDNVVFASDVSFAVGSPISFVIAAPEELRLECCGVVTYDRQNPAGGFETAATIDSIHIVPSTSIKG
jgi:hypothetical protein